MIFKLIAIFSLVLISTVFGQNWNRDRNDNDWNNRNGNGGNNGWNNGGSNGGWNNGGSNGGWNNGPSPWGNDKNNQGRRTTWGETREERLAQSIFDQNRWGGPAVAECPNENIGWARKTWTAGGIRPYYVSKGFRNDFEECLRECQRQPDCYFATYTSKKNCYFLTTSDDDMCQYLKSGHFGEMGEKCTGWEPCPSAYKQCNEPRCTLLSIATIYCNTNDQVKAVTTCIDTV